jgi:hypothetical protein
MRTVAFVLLLLAVCCTLVLADECRQVALGYVDAMNNALIGDGSWNQPTVTLPTGTTSATVTVAGTAWAEPNVQFGGVVLFYRTALSAATYKAAPVGAVTTITGLTEPIVYASFADLDPSDNLGALTVTVTPAQGPASMVIDARAHCFTMSDAAVMELGTLRTCTIEATGEAFHDERQYASAILSYLSDNNPPKRMFGEVFSGAGERQLLGLGTRTLYIFFQDCCIGDNSGGFEIRVKLDDPYVPVEETTWGQIKGRMD